MTTPIVVPQSPMGLGDVFSASFSIVKRRFSRLVVIALVQQLVTAMIALPVVLFAMLVMLPQLEYTSSRLSNGYLASSGIGTAIGAVFGLAATVVSVYFQGLLVHASHQALLNQNPTLAELRVLNRGTLRRLGPVYLVAGLAYCLFLALGMLPMLSLFPDLMRSSNSRMSDELALRFLGVYALMMVTVGVVSLVSGIVLVKTIYINQVGTVEALGWTAAIKRAWALTKGSFWRTAGYLIVMSLAVGVVQQAVGIVVEVGFFAFLSPRLMVSELASLITSGGLWLMYGVMYGLMALVQIVLAPFQQAFVTVMYVDQVRRIAQGPVPRPVPGQYGWQVPTR